jgi:hypothetical protein
MRCVVEFSDANDTLRIWEQLPGIGAQIAAVVCEVGHFTGAARGPPVVKALEIVGRFSRSHSRQLKSAGMRERLYLLRGNTQSGAC